MCVKDVDIPGSILWKSLSDLGRKKTSLTIFSNLLINLCRLKAHLQKKGGPKKPRKGKKKRRHRQTADGITTVIRIMLHVHVILKI